MKFKSKRSNSVNRGSSLHSCRSNQIMFTRKEPLSASDEMELILKAQDGDDSAANLLIEHNLGFLWQLATKTKHNPYHVDMADLFQQACLYAKECIPKFEPAKGFRFCTFMGTVVRMSLWRYASDHNGVLASLEIKGKPLTGRKLSRLRVKFPCIGIPSTCEPRAPEGTAEHQASKDSEDKLGYLLYLIERLPENQRYVLQQRMNGRTLEDLGNELGCSRENIRTLQARAEAELELGMREKFNRFVGGRKVKERQLESQPN